VIVIATGKPSLDTDADIDIVPIGTAEASAMAPIHAASFPEAWTEAALARLLKADAARALGAFAGYAREPHGFVLAFAATDEAEILTIAVPPSRRRKGTGAKLLRALQDQLREEGITRLFLEVAADNAAAYGLYRRTGFVETGRRKGYYIRDAGPPVDALTLALTLAPLPAEPPLPTAP
jgi:[ribosomal protein S18]-alanine N-acetyltransferase